MEEAWLRSQLESGRSIESIAREAGKRALDRRLLGRQARPRVAARRAPRRARRRSPASARGLARGAACRSARWRARLGRELRRPSGTGWPVRPHDAARPAAGGDSAARRRGRRVEAHVPGPRLDAFVRYAARTAFRCRRCRTERVDGAPRARSRRSSWRRPAAAAGSAATTALRRRCSSTTSIRRTKAFALAARGMRARWSAAARRRAKCVLLCANCHAEVEAGSLPSRRDRR